MHRIVRYYAKASRPATAAIKTALIEAAPTRPHYIRNLKKQPASTDKVLQKYPIDAAFIKEAASQSRGLLFPSVNKDRPLVSPILRLRHASIAARNMQEQLAEAIAFELKAAFLCIDRPLIDRIGIDRLSSTPVEGPRTGSIVGENDMNLGGVRDITLSSLIALQSSKTNNTALFPTKGLRLRQSPAAVNSDFLMFTIPAMSFLLDAAVNELPEGKLLVCYLRDLDDWAPNAKDRRLLADFVDSYNRGSGRPMIMCIAPQYCDSNGSEYYATGLADKSAATGNEGYKLADDSTSVMQKSRYGPLWQPIQSGVNMVDRVMSLPIPRPSDPINAKALQAALHADETRMIGECNLTELRNAFDRMVVDHQLRKCPNELRKRIKGKDDLLRIAIGAKGLADGDVIRDEHIEAILALQSCQLDEASRETQFSHLIAADQLNQHERQLLRFCVTTPGNAHIPLLTI